MILTPQQNKAYKALYRVKGREAWSEYRRVVIMSHPAGWWTDDTKSAVMAEIAEIEAKTRRRK